MVASEWRLREGERGEGAPIVCPWRRKRIRICSYRRNVSAQELLTVQLNVQGMESMWGFLRQQEEESHEKVD